MNITYPIFKMLENEINQYLVFQKYLLCINNKYVFWYLYSIQLGDGCKYMYSRPVRP